MESQTLQDFVAVNGQVPTAEGLGLTQGAISQMLIKEREVYLTVNPDGSIRYAYEIRPVGKFKD